MRGNIERGRELYLSHCAICHGSRGDGEGLRKMGLSSKPRNFCDPAWRARTSDRDILQAIRNGVGGTSMPAFSSLDDAQTRDLAAYVLSMHCGW